MSSNPSQFQSSMDQSYVIENQFYINPHPDFRQHPLPLPPNFNENHGYESQCMNEVPIYNVASGSSRHMTVPRNENIHVYPKETDGYGVVTNRPRALIEPDFHQDARLPPIIELPRNTVNKINEGDVSKRTRTVFTTFQRSTLQKEFAVNRFVDRQRRKVIAEMLQLSENTVKVWFQNRRMDIKHKDKNKVSHANDDDRDSSMSPVSSTVSYDDGSYTSSPGYQLPQDCNQTMSGPLWSSESDGYSDPGYAGYPSTAYSQALLPINNLDRDFEISDSEQLASLTVNLIRDELATDSNITIGTAPRPPDNEEDTNENRFSVMEYMNIEE